MHGRNKLQIGLFGANCSSGRAVTLVPERWSGSWPDNKKLAVMADDAGIDFLLPIGRWKGYGGDTDYQGTTLETITWATGLLAATRRITVFGTVHAPIFNPVVAAKEMVTADHIGEGRFGLNIVVGWNEGEFDMFGVEQRAHEDRYAYAQEWIDVIKLIWSDREDFDFDGKYLHMKGIRGKPKPYGGTRPVIMNAGASATGQAFAVKNCDAFFLQASRTSLDETAGWCAAPNKPPASRAATSAVTPSASSPANRPGRRPRSISTTASSSAPTGRRSTAFWRSRTSRRRPCRWPNISSSAANTRKAWAACRSSAIPIMSRRNLPISARPGLPASPYRSSIISMSCRIFATRSSAGWSAWG